MSATISIEEAADILGIGRSAAYEAARSGAIPAVRIGPKLLRVPKAALARMLGADSLEAAAAVELPQLVGSGDE